MLQLSPVNPHKWNSEKADSICKFAQRYGISEDAGKRECSLFKDSQVFASLLTGIEEKREKQQI